VSFLGVFAVEWPCSQPTSVEIFLHVFWHLDILMTFITAIYCRGELVVAPKRIARNYAQGWLCFDVLYLLGAFYFHFHMMIVIVIKSIRYNGMLVGW